MKTFNQIFSDVNFEQLRNVVNQEIRKAKVVKPKIELAEQLRMLAKIKGESWQLRRDIIAHDMSEEEIEMYKKSCMERCRLSDVTLDELASYLVISRWL